MDSWRRNPLVFWVISLPPTFWLLVFFLVPLGLIWVLSFGEKRGVVDIEITWVLDNYTRALDPLYIRIFVKSLWMATATTLLCLLVGFPVAFMITFAPARWRPLLLLLIILPFWTNLLIRTYALIAVLRIGADLTMEWNGDILQVMEEDDDISYVVPKEGGLLWQDCLCIPVGAPHPENAHKFINYILDAKAGAAIADFIYYATPNKAAKNLLSSSSMT